MFPLWVRPNVELVHHLFRQHPAVSLDANVDTNKELVGHGYSNLLAGLFGTVYVNSYFSVRANLVLHADQTILYT